MDIDYEDVISMKGLESAIVQRRTTVRYLSEDCGVHRNLISRAISGAAFPKSDVIAKMSYHLGVKPSEIVQFKGIEPNAAQAKWFREHSLKYKTGEDAVGELSYAPLWELMKGFLEEVNKGKKEGERLMTEKDVFDSIEPYRRRNGMSNPFTEETQRKAAIARGFDPDHIKINPRVYKAKGLIPEVRTKLRNDRPISLRMVYDICKRFGCSIDWVIGYK